MIKKILVPLDGSGLAEQTIFYVSFLAKELGAQVKLFRVIEPLPSAGLDDFAREAHRQSILGEMSRKAEAYLDDVAARPIWEGVEVSYEVSRGHPASQILETIKDEPETLIALSTHGRSGISRWLLGSVADKVLHSTTNPLLIIRSQAEAPGPKLEFSTIVVPLDGSELAEQILPHVTSLAKVMKLKVDLITAIPSSGDPLFRLEIMPVSGRGPSVEMKEHAEAYLHKTAKKLQDNGVGTVEEHVIEGHPAVAIIDYARTVSSNVIAMASHGRSGIGRWVLGSITDLVARNSGEPVLVVHARELEPTKE